MPNPKFTTKKTLLVIDTWTGRTMGMSICGMSYIMLRAKKAFPDERMESVWHSYCLPYPLAVFLPEVSQGQRSLAGCGPQGHQELDSTEMS